MKHVRPAVVRIHATSGYGTGVIFETQGQTGYVMTNYHIIQGHAQVNVIVNDSTTYLGSVLGSDRIRDLAVVSICCSSFQTLSFGNSANLQPGDEVVAIGYALGLSGEATVTRGIVSAVRYDESHRSDVIQTDAALNPGNSGGPMLSTSGEILGINTFRREETQGGRPVVGVGFPISENTVQQRIPALKTEQTVPTLTPTRRPTASPRAGTTSDFGPVDGELRHSPSDGFIKTEFANVSIADLMVEATFVNPYPAASNGWDYGFILRRGITDPTIQILVTSDRRWVAQTRDPDVTYTNRIGGGTLRTFDTGADGQNHLRVVAVRERGWLFVNGEFVSALDLSDVSGAGGVAVITGAFTGNEVAGAVTRFKNFRGSRLTRRYGPADGELARSQAGISTHQSGVRTRDLVAEAEFVSPQGSDWSYGFFIRNPEFNLLELIGLTGEGWLHYTRDVDDEDYTAMAYGYLSDSGIGLLSRNHLLVIAIEESGWFFVNDQLVTKLDLEHNLNSSHRAYAIPPFRGNFTNL